MPRFETEAKTKAEAEIRRDRGEELLLGVDGDGTAAGVTDDATTLVVEREVFTLAVWRHGGDERAVDLSSAAEGDALHLAIRGRLVA
jgi:hypothetical protein